MFGLFKAGRAPRWGFTVGWDDFLLAVKAELTRRRIVFTDHDLTHGLVPLAEPAAFEAWDLRAIATRCRDLQPHEWQDALRASVDAAIGVAAADEPPAAVPAREPRPPREPRPRRDPRVQRSQLRVQVFDGKLAALLSEKVAKRPLGDAAVILVADYGVAEDTLQWSEIEALGLTRDKAFALGQRNAAAHMRDAIHIETLAMPGATAELFVANDFFLGGALLEIRAHAQARLPLVVAAISWHHWISFELKPGATRETLVATRGLVDRVAGGITTISNTSAWLPRSLWWWPTGVAEPVVIDDAALPADLAARLDQR